ncbi:hypothetical protein BH09BAC5_BH09BAC5_01850 [soil metagenome]
MSEKRHFKLFSARQSGGKSKNYLRLFDAIAQQDYYDEEKIKDEFETSNFIRHLPYEKNYLYAHLLEGLNSYNREKTFLARHSNYLISIELLFNRGLFQQCRKIIRKAKSEAISLEKFSVLLLIIRWETLVFINNEDDKNLNLNLQEEIRILEMMKVQTILMQIAFTMQIQIDKGKVSDSFLKNSLQDLKKNYPLRQDMQSFWVNYYYHSTLGLIFTVQNKHLKRYSCYKEIKVIMDKAPQFIVDLPAIYHTNSNNLVNVMCFLGKYDEAENIVNSQQKFTTTYKINRPGLSDIIFLNTSESRLFIIYKTGRKEDVGALVRQIEIRLRKIDPNINPVIFDLMFMMSVSELMVNNFKGALKWLNQILNTEREIKSRKELQINARLLYILVLFESHDKLFENHLNSAKRFIVQDSKFHNELIVVEAIRILADPKLLKKNKAEIPGLIQRIRKDSRRTNEAALNKQFDFAEWIEKKYVEISQQ